MASTTFFFTEIPSNPKDDEKNFTNNTALKAEASVCIVQSFEGTLPWNNPDSLVSVETEDLVRRVRDIVVLPILFLIGGPANVINMAVFYRQGLKERINVCLFALSLADLLYLSNNMLLYAEQIYFQSTTKEKYGPILRFMISNNLLGFYGFTWVSEIISAIIASERCFCVLWPLRSQTILSTSTTIAIIIVTNIVVVGLYFFITTRFDMACTYDPATDTKSWAIVPGQVYLDNQKIIDFLDAFVYGVGIPLVMIVVVAVTTVVTMVKLRQAAAWRAGTSSSSSSSSSRSSVSSAREVALTVMLVYNSIFFVVCVFPVALFRLVWLFIPAMNAGGPQHNLFFTCIWLMDIVTYINATFNILIYYTMGSRYRQNFWQILGCTGSTSKSDPKKQSKVKDTPPPPPAPAPAAAISSSSEH